MSLMEITLGMIWSFITSLLTVFGVVIAFTLKAGRLKSDVDTLKKDFGKHCEESDDYRQRTTNNEIVLESMKTDLVWIKTMLLKIDERMQS